MIIENFAQKVVTSGVMQTYIATGFFATLIFFIINVNSFTPMEMMLGTIISTIAVKGISNVMLSMVILLFNLDAEQKLKNIKITGDKVDLLLNELQMKETKLKSEKVSENK
jgi:hypothetical protein